MDGPVPSAPLSSQPTPSAQPSTASVRNTTHLLRAASVGADIATVPFAVLKRTLNHPLTDLGLERFLADWRKTNQKI